jgi:hypothetical protein
MQAVSKSNHIDTLHSSWNWYRIGRKILITKCRSWTAMVIPCSADKHFTNDSIQQMHLLACNFECATHFNFWYLWNNFCTIPYPVEWSSCAESNPSSLSAINVKFISNTWSLSWGRHAGPITLSYVWTNQKFDESTCLTQKSCQSWSESSNQKTQKGCVWPIRGTSPCNIALGTLTSKKHLVSPTYRRGCWCKGCFNACWIR